VQLLPNHCEFSKVLVQSNQDSILAARRFEHHLITGIALSIATPNHVVTQCLQRRLAPSPDARIQQQFHADFFSITSGSIRS
jgi:hypothetical protein